jgi:hypothetical protein
LIRRRQVFFVQGYDPQGSAGFYDILRREWSRFRDTWSIKGHLGQLENDSNEVAHCVIEASGPHWRVETRYEFLRLEQFIRPNMAQPMWRQLARTAGWMLDDFASGALFRTFRASWKIGALLLYSQVLLIAWLALAIAGGALSAIAATRFTDASGSGAASVALTAAAVTFLALRPLAGRLYVIQLNNCWPYLREMARGKITDCDRMIDVFAKRLVAAAHAGAADEILIVGHSAGAMTGLAVVVRALELDPQLGERGPRVALMTAGSLIPALALHPAAEKLRREIRRLALEPTVLWVDCQAREDFMNFWDFDPVAGSGVQIGAARRNPRIWHVPFTDMLSPEFYKRARWNFFRMHFQYIMANQRRASYDYFMFVCGHVPFVEWVARGALRPTLDPGHSCTINVETDEPAPEEVARRIARELGS